MELFLWILGGIGVLFAIAIIVAVGQGREQREKAEKGTKVLKDQLGASDAYVSPFDATCVGIDWDRQLIFAGLAPDKIETYEFKKLLRAEIDIDGTTVTSTESTTRTRRGAQVAGAAVGGIAFGPLGLLVGGFTGGSRTAASVLDKKFISSLSLKLHFRHRVSPIQTVTFFSWTGGGNGIPHNNPLLKPCVENANRYHALMSQILDEQAIEPAETQEAAPDLTGELERLWHLRQAGALTDAEYTERKRYLLRK